MAVDPAERGASVWVQLAGRAAATAAPMFSGIPARAGLHFVVDLCRGDAVSILGAD